MDSVSSIATNALAAYGVRQAVTAGNVANINTPDYKASSVVMQENKAGGVSAAVSQGSDIVEISKEATDMITTSRGYRTNLKVLQAGEEMTRALLDIKA